MTVPLILLAVLSLAGGWVGIPEIFKAGGDQLGAFLRPVIPAGAEHHVSHSTEYLLMGLSTGGVLLVIVVAWTLYRRFVPRESTGLARVLENKWYVDEIYEAAIVKPVKALGQFLSSVFDRSVVDGLVNGAGRLVQYGGRQLRWLQSGQTGSYVLLMVVSMVVFFIVQFLIRK
jgi:NADH-quinone oxidoreductase subunit L